MKRKSVIFITLALFILSGTLFADAPVRNEELVYSVMAFNGRDYSGTFARQEADTIYLLADVDNFLSIRKTLVYFWPITSEWRTDSESLNISFKGTLELNGKSFDGEIVEPVRYTYYNIQGDYEYNWVVAKGEEADRKFVEYGMMVDDYYDRVRNYQQEKALYDYFFDKLIEEISKLRQEGKDITQLVEQANKAEPPPQPELPSTYISPPVPIREAFIINLPTGEYTIRFINEDGTVMDGSDKRLVVFQNRRKEGVGFEVIPEERWTRPEESWKSASVLYLDGSGDIFIRPFFQQEFNDLYYNKMVQNDSRGNPSLMRWVRIQQVPGATLKVEIPGAQTIKLSEKPFMVEQVEGASLGYRIVPYDPEGVHKDRDPNLIAFHIPINGEVKFLRMRAFDMNGTELEGSKRQIRIISSWRAQALLIVLALAPLLVLAIVRILRNRRYG